MVTIGANPIILIWDDKKIIDDTKIESLSEVIMMVSIFIPLPILLQRQ